MKRRTLSVLCVAVLAGGLLFHSFERAVRGQAGAGSKPPVVRLQGIDRQFYDVAEMRGSVVLISFGATWCAPCSGELIALEDLKREYQGKPVKFFWVSLENDGQISDSGLKRYAAERKVSFPVLRDPTRTAFGQFSPRVRLPMIVVFDKEGQVDGPAQFGMGSDVDSYKARLRVRLDTLLARVPTP
jgi:peroxiredoxin